MQNQFSIIAMIEQGWYATGPLLLISVICVTIIIERIWTLWGISRGAASAADAAIGPLRQGQFSEALDRLRQRRGPGERIFQELITEAELADRSRLEEVDEERRFAELVRLRGPIWVLATSGASAPF